MPCASTYTLDRDLTITDTDGTYPSLVAFVGRNVFDAYPGFEQAAGDLFDLAWRDGCHARVISYAGTHVRLIAVRDDDRLCVWVTSVTLDGLKCVLDAELQAAQQAAA